MVEKNLDVKYVSERVSVRLFFVGPHVWEWRPCRGRWACIWVSVLDHQSAQNSHVC